MPQALSIVFGAGFTVVVSLALGRLLLRSFKARLYRQEENVLAFVSGAACLSLLTFFLCTVGAARKGVFLAVGVTLLAIAVWRGAHRATGESFAPLPPLWRWLFRSIFAIFFVLYFINAMAPEMSADGVAYHLGVVSRYLRAHGFERITTNMYASLSEGIELLFLFAFAFGRHSAAALTHFAFLVTLPLAMLSYARRFGFPAAGVCAALLVFVSPVAGMDGTVAYNDIATACIVFTVFYLAQIWASDESNSGLLVPLGLVAGFGYAAKYTAFLAVPYALGIVAWKSIRGGQPVVKRILVVTAWAAIMIAPWMIKNAVWLGNPVSPFLSEFFPNPYIHLSVLKDYTEYLRHYDLTSNREIPLEVTVRGALLCGLLGPIFLLAPIGLLALRWPAGRTLLLAAMVFLIPFPANIGTRFLLPALPFVALSMGLVVAQSSAAALALVLAHAVLSWPSVIGMYSDPRAWRLENKIPIRQALRIESEESYVNFKMASYGMARLIEHYVPPGGRVFTWGGAAESYTPREIVIAYQSAFGSSIGDLLWTPLVREVPATWLLRFHYPAQRLRQIRVVQTATAADQWSVSEFRIYNGTAELARAANWKLRARPNPWDVQLAFDNSPVTRWRSWQAITPDMSLSVEFGTPEISDSVLLECSHDQYKIQLKLEGMDESGKWIALAGAPEATDIPEPLGLRRAVVEEVKARDIHYMLVLDTDFGAADFQNRSNVWGITMLGDHRGAKLYHLD